MNTIRGDLTDALAKTKPLARIRVRLVCNGHLCCIRPVVFFSKLNYYFLDTLTQKIYFLVIKINNFWGDLSGISAKKSSLHQTRYIKYRNCTKCISDTLTEKYLLCTWWGNDLRVDRTDTSAHSYSLIRTCDLQQHSHQRKQHGCYVSTTCVVVQSITTKRCLV